MGCGAAAYGTGYGGWTLENLGHCGGGGVGGQCTYWHSGVEWHLGHCRFRYIFVICCMLPNIESCEKVSKFPNNVECGTKKHMHRCKYF